MLKRSVDGIKNNADIETKERKEAGEYNNPTMDELDRQSPDTKDEQHASIVQPSESNYMTHLTHTVHSLNGSFQSSSSSYESGVSGPQVPDVEPMAIRFSSVSSDAVEPEVPVPGAVTPTAEERREHQCIAGKRKR